MLYTVKTAAEYNANGKTRTERHTYRGQTAEQAQWHRDYMKTNAPVGSTYSVTVTAQH